MRTLWFVAAVAALSACHKSETEYVAAEAASLSMETPAPADWLPAGGVVAEGTVTGLSSVEVNGVPAAVSGGAWSAPVPLARGINAVEVRGVDATGHTIYLRNSVLAGKFGSDSDPVGDALIVRLNEPGLDFALAEVGALLDAETLNATIAGANPVYEDAYGILGWNAVEVSADVGSLWFDAPGLDATPTDGTLEVEIEIPNLDVWIPVTGSVVGIPFSVDCWMWAEQATLTADLSVHAENGKLVPELLGSEVQLIGFDFDTSLLPWGIESLLLVDTVRGALEDLLVEKIDLLVPALLDAQLAGLDLSFDTELLGTELSVSADFVSAFVDADGLQIAADIDVSSPKTGKRTYVGPLLAPGNKVPTPDIAGDVALSISDDLLNRVMFELWGGGLLDLALSTEDGSLDAVLLTQLGAKDEASIVVTPSLPPVIVQGDHGAQLQIGELQAEILTPGGEHGERVVLSVTAMVDVELAVLNNIVVMTLGEPELSMVVRDNDWHASNESLTNALVEAIPVDLLLGLISDIELPLPTLGGIGVGRATVTRDASEVHTGVTISLQ